MKIILRRIAITLLFLTPAVAVAGTVADRAGSSSCCPSPCCPDCDDCPLR